MVYRLSIGLLLIGSVISIEEKYKFCAPETMTDSTCNSLARGTSRVSCLKVTDSVECAIKLAEGKADFAVYNAEEMLLAHQFYPDAMRVVAQLRHEDRFDEDYEFQSVVVVPESFDSRVGLPALKNAGLCHPGFSDTQIWNDRILKYFEKKVYEAPCRSWHITATENEVENLKDFFGNGCRPGEWIADQMEDKKLKSNHPELCELCDDKKNCMYRNTAHHGHFGALECLVSGRGKVAYVAYEYVRQFFGLASNVSISPLAVPNGFNFLCEDGTTRPLTSNDPCAWIKQPWSTVVARTDIAKEISTELKYWLANTTGMDRAPPDWKSVLKSIILSDVGPSYYSEPLSLRNYLTEGRSVDVPKNNPCAKKIRWCTVNEPEMNKCNWIAKEAIIGLDIVPNMECVIANSTFECLRNIAENKADIITIDSNYGYIARKVFNLRTIMYAESESDRDSQVVAVVLDDAPNKVTSFRSLKKRMACFPEYGGIAWLSFVNVARSSKIISDSCDHARVVSEFFSGACAPGIKDSDHSIVPPDSTVSSKLCSLCPPESGTGATCSASRDNYYYGDKGALECLKSGAGDVAFVETKNLWGLIVGEPINPNDYRVLCKNGSLAMNTGFIVDEPCVLSMTIDSEIIGQKENIDKNDERVLTADMTSALLKLENWLGYRPDVLRPIRIYDSFTGYSDLLFKDSTIGLEPPTSEIKSVLAYKELFSNIDSCSGVKNVAANIFTIFLLIAYTFARYF